MIYNSSTSLCNTIEKTNCIQCYHCYLPSISNYSIFFINSDLKSRLDKGTVFVSSMLKIHVWPRALGLLSCFSVVMIIRVIISALQVYSRGYYCLARVSFVIMLVPPTAYSLSPPVALTNGFPLSTSANGIIM